LRFRILGNKACVRVNWIRLIIW